MSFKATVKPWGQSLGLILPKAEAKAFGIEIGQTVEIEIRPKFKLANVYGALPDIEERAGMPLRDFMKLIKEEMRSKWD